MERVIPGTHRGHNGHGCHCSYVCSGRDHERRGQELRQAGPDKFEQTGADPNQFEQAEVGPYQVEHVMVGPHISLLVGGKVPPK